MSYGEVVGTWPAWIALDQFSSHVLPWRDARAGMTGQAGRRIRIVLCHADGTGTDGCESSNHAGTSGWLVHDVTVAEQIIPGFASAEGFESRWGALSWNTFTVTEVGFGDTVVAIPRRSHRYQNTVAMTCDAAPFYVEIDIGLNLGTVASYTVCASDNGGTFEEWPVISDAISGTRYGEGERTYSYHVRATGSTGRTEAPETEPEAAARANDVTGPTVVSTIPVADPIARADSGTHEISLTFDEPMEASTAEDVLNYTLLEAGRTGAFDDGDDVLIGITELAIAETELSATLTVNSGTTLPAGFYRLTVSDALQDKAGNALDGNGDGAPGGEFVLVFGLASPRAAAYLHVYRAMDQVGYVSATPRRAVPLLARSYTPATTTDPFDVQNGAVATVYDNSLAILALLLRGRPEDLARARTLADALTYAQENDTSPAPADWPHNPAPFEGHRLRDAYASGDIVDEHGAFRLPGWWDAQAEQWMMHGLALSFRTGDLAWATLALARAHEMLGDPDYLDAAEAMASWAGANCTRPGNGVGAGYSGGWIWDWGTTAWQESGTSIEHNADLAAAFTALHEITGNDSWQQHAAHAREFVLAMWDADNGYFHTGVALDGSAETVETTDAQALSAMLLESPPYWDALSRAAANTSLGAASRQRGEGVLFDFDSDLDGAWYEGTSQMAVAFSRANDSARAAATLGALRSAQITAAHANGRGMPAADTYGLTTGFGWQYHNRLSLSSTTWFIFAERRYNPLRNRWFTGVSLRPGWNLVSIPTPCSTPVDELFTDADGQSLKSGQTHWWDPVNNCYQDLLGDAPLQAQLGCWAFAQEPGKTGGIPGLSALDPILLTIGWNVVGPTSSCLLPASAKDLIDETVWVWDAAALRYRPLGATERLEPGCAYWVYAFSAGELHLRE